ncbi:unnamed protein product [Rhizophagus irregularis]|uniref:Uncharacterized protein n=1 Tax=Rhizophagus irregularis TaxID=588596 RepID=A0A916E637_9GLOM|nr:unnamed protein product [Rhizophagus irregularis]
MRENNSDSENELESEETLAFFTSQLRVPKVIYTTVPIEYPDTSSEGVATVYNVTGWKNHTDAFSDFTDPELVNQEHCSVDFDSEIFQHYTQQNNNNTKEAKTYTLFLAAKDTPCSASVQDTVKCSMILSKSCKRKKCDMPHTHNGTIVRGEIIDKPCQVRFIKFIPYDIVKCPFVALINIVRKSTQCLF